MVIASCVTVTVEETASPEWHGARAGRLRLDGGLMDVTRGRYSITTDPQRLDLDAIHAFLSRSFWAAGIPKERSPGRWPTRCVLGCSTARHADRICARRDRSRDVRVSLRCLRAGGPPSPRPWQVAHRNSDGASRSTGAAAVPSRHPRRAWPVQPSGFEAPSDPERHMEIFRHGMYERELIMAVKAVPEGYHTVQPVLRSSRGRKVCSSS